MGKLALIGQIFFALALIGLGVEHFIFQDFVTGRAPAWRLFQVNRYGHI